MAKTDTLRDSREVGEHLLPHAGQKAASSCSPPGVSVLLVPSDVGDLACVVAVSSVRGGGGQTRTGAWTAVPTLAGDGPQA